jgi:two-component system phosphate regulon sensor histidine kinase PhoR
MPGHRLFWRLYGVFGLLIIVGAAVFAWYTANSFRKTNIDRATADIVNQVSLIQQILSKRPATEDPSQLDSLISAIAAGSDIRISILLPPGRVIADSRGRTGLVHDQANYPEIVAALSGKIGSSIRYSNSEASNAIYAAAPIPFGKSPKEIARVEMSLGPFEHAIESMRMWLFAGTIILLLLSAVFCRLIERSIFRPLDRLRSESERFASGDMDTLIGIGAGTVSQPLARAVNEMARQLSDRIQAVTRQRNEQEAILTSMAEGVLAVDSNENVININRAAVRLIGLDPKMIQGRPIVEVIRNTELQSLVTRTLQGNSPVEMDVVLTDNGEQHFQAHGVPLRDADGRSLGALVVLNDVTLLRRLENIRRDFVANVSHELKTPITSIKGFVETLRESSVIDPGETKRFLDIIARHTDRLNSIIEDLLTLSRIEQEAESAHIPLEKSAIAPVLQSAVHACEALAAEKRIAVTCECDKSIAAVINVPLLEQAVINLINNAIKYSDPGKSVQVTAEVKPDETVISVSDFGIGIGHEHQSRIFERFYRVDKARSRSLGGTGLGLAIVKHIVLAHNGHVSVESTLGRGSIFRIHLLS